MNSPVPTTVIVFKSDSSFGPYKPLFRGRPADVAGYFQSGYDMNYITLSPSERRQGDPYEMIFHESVHLLVDNRVRTSPAWFNEGLAEYFSALVFLKYKTDGSKQARITLKAFASSSPGLSFGNPGDPIHFSTTQLCKSCVVIRRPQSSRNSFRVAKNLLPVF